MSRRAGKGREGLPGSAAARRVLRVPGPFPLSGCRSAGSGQCQKWSWPAGQSRAMKAWSSSP